MIFRILLVAALFVTATMAGRHKFKTIDNPGCKCGPTAYSPKLISTTMNRAAKVKLNTNLNVGTSASYPQKFANTRELIVELCAGVAADQISEYPLLTGWKQGKTPGIHFVLYDSQNNKFCGCYRRTTVDLLVMCPALVGGRQEGPGESSHPVSGPAGPAPVPAE